MKIADKFEVWPISRLKPYSKNARTHSDEQVAQIAASISEFGFTNPILVDSEDGIIAGHGRLMAAQKLGLTEAPVVVLDHLTDAQRRAYILADNKLALNAGWDENLLADELRSLDAEGFDLGLTGFSDDELADLLPEVEVLEPQSDEDAVPDALPDPKVVIGEVYILGKHRLMCGDSTAITDVDRLLDGDKVDMVFTDPPYGISYSSEKFSGNKGGVTNKRNKAEMIIGDDDDYDPSFILGLFEYCREIFVWGFQFYPHRLGRGGIIVWNKKNETEQHNPHGDFELCWSKSERNKMFWHRWGGFRNKEKGEDRLHTTQKPVALAQWFFDNWGNGKTRVIDLFGGSGSTMIACEKTGRKCFMMELDPHYCGVILDRWQKFTGKKAYREDGKAWDESKAQ